MSSDVTKELLSLLLLVLKTERNNAIQNVVAQEANQSVARSRIHLSEAYSWEDMPASALSLQSHTNFLIHDKFM